VTFDDICGHLKNRADAPWWLNEPELIELAKSAQKLRLELDAWHGVIGEWIGEQPGTVSTDDVLTHCIKKPLEHWNKGS
jgi:hypothetical protein